jgi:hypothetical protein
MNTYTLSTSLLLLLFCTSCVKEDHFEFSDRASILNITVTGQSGVAEIDDEAAEVNIDVANGTDLDSIKLTTLDLSALASSSVPLNSTLNFTDDSTSLLITAEDGTQREWTIYVNEIGSSPQIPNSDFNTWYNYEDSYLELGESEANSVWGTSNPGVKFASLPANVVQEQIAPGDFAVKMITRYSKFNAIFNKPIAAGSAFTGEFETDNISLSDPEAAIDFGYPFTGTPESFSIEYSYVPGENNIDSKSNPLDYDDVGDVYVLLERREDDVVKRVGTAWYRIDETVENLTPLSQEFTYGKLPANTPDYMLPGADEEYAEAGAAPTHIIVVFSSSANGSSFEGAEGSTLVVNNFELNY